MKNRTTATTRTVTRGPARFAPARPLLEAGQSLVSPESRLEYRIGECLGEGGFGQVYLAQRRTPSTHVAGVVCIKVSQRMDGWLREAYFGQVLEDHPRAIRVYEAFPRVNASGTLYCLVLEYARHGDLRAFLRRLDRG